jgi:hypothetical protein
VTALRGHAGQNYFLSTDVLNGVEAADIFSEMLGRQIAPVVMTPSDMLVAFASGAAKSPPGMEENYAKSQLRFPGTEKTYGILYQITSAEILAKATRWVRPVRGG